MPPVPERIVTSFSDALAVHGERCVDSLAKYAPDEFAWYVDGPVKGWNPSCTTDDIPDWLTTRATLPIRRHDAEKPDNYIWNARKFAVKPFVWLDAAERLENGVLVWLDADTVLHRSIPRGFFDDLLGDASVAYLGRGEMHPETGFVAFRVPEALPLLRWCVDFYRLHEWMTQDDGWTDCHALRAGMKATLAPPACRDLTSHLHDNWRSTVDAFALSPLGPYIEHLKGTKRKREAVTA